jgi:hypothetical protein
MRILVKNEATAANNGIYVRTSSTVLTRATDFDTGAEIQGGDFTFVTAGTLYNSTGWVQVDEVTIIGTDPIEWVQFSGAGEYTAGTGLTLTGGAFSITNTAVSAGSYGNGDSVATFTVNGQGQLTAAANVAITANAANLTGTTLNASVVTSSLTSVGTLTGLTSNGIVNFANTSNVTLGAVANLRIANGTANQFLQTNGSGNVTWAQATPIITDNTSSGSTFYPVYATSTSGGLLTAGITTTKLQFIPSTGQLTVQDLNTLSDATLKENPQSITDPMSILSQLFGMGLIGQTVRKNHMV